MKRPTTRQQIWQLKPEEVLALFCQLFIVIVSDEYLVNPRYPEKWLQKRPEKPSFTLTYRGDDNYVGQRWHARVSTRHRRAPMGVIDGMGIGETKAEALMKAIVEWKIMILEYRKARRKAARDDR